MNCENLRIKAKYIVKYLDSAVDKIISTIINEKNTKNTVKLILQLGNLTSLLYWAAKDEYCENKDNNELNELSSVFYEICAYTSDLTSRPVTEKRNDKTARDQRRLVALQKIKKVIAENFGCVDT